MPEPVTRIVESSDAAHERMQAALAQVQTPWDAARTERTLRTLPAARRKKQVRRAIGSGLVAALVLGPTLWLGLARHELPRASVDPRASEPTVANHAAAVDEANDARHLRLRDGSSVLLLEADTDVGVERVDEHLVELALREGRARFEVSARPERLFRVRTAEVTVEVLGTIFEVEQQAGRTRVSVARGRVAVSRGDQRDVLVAGDERVFSASAIDARRSDTGSVDTTLATDLETGARTPARTHASRRASAGATGPRAAGHGSTTNAQPEHPGDSWREHAEGGDFKSAFPLLPKPDTMAAMSVSDLMLAADAARLSGHPREALPYLTRVVEAHAEDTRAPLAAFTLGGVLMHQLGLPREAEAAYGRARATTTSDALAQDALARQVEAASRAGDETLAQKLARVYLDKYPDGRRVNAVRRFGRL